MTDLLPVSLDEEIVCVKREIAMRVRNYPGWVRTGRLKLDRADREIEIMRAVLDRLIGIKEAAGTTGGCGA